MRIWNLIRAFGFKLHASTHWYFIKDRVFSNIVKISSLLFTAIPTFDWALVQLNIKYSPFIIGNIVQIWIGAALILASWLLYLFLAPPFIKQKALGAEAYINNHTALKNAIVDPIRNGHAMKGSITPTVLNLIRESTNPDKNILEQSILHDSVNSVRIVQNLNFLPQQTGVLIESAIALNDYSKPIARPIVATLFIAGALILFIPTLFRIFHYLTRIT
ncbi:MAG: hypothetical protein OJJ21_03640 [Ferrovibrio sp.]|uniref:hypothetical protein n=1 Tax=Ferrovibrio sp. TaxID=1917215 RepID=UPI00262AE2BB|nr:hypothetical protein [Ferrovibrio sp.]MCW0232671.1 hypothetical protein [Ferrovibrio sp.]